jgi:hypothetical protein
LAWRKECAAGFGIESESQSDGDGLDDFGYAEDMPGPDASVGPPDATAPSPRRELPVADVDDKWGTKPTWSPITLTPADRVRCMAFDFGIGIDCAGYAHQALLYAHGGTDRPYNLKSLGNENFMALSANRAWQPAGVDAARPGDIMALRPAAAGGVGHVITVYDHQVATAQGDRDTLAAPVLALVYGSQTDQVKSLLAVTGSVHLFLLDASWGAHAYPVGDGAGVQRRKALAIEGPDGRGYSWICQARKGYFLQNDSSPWGDPFDNIYHPRAG